MSGTRKKQKTDVRGARRGGGPVRLAPDAYGARPVPRRGEMERLFETHLQNDCPAPKAHARLADCHTFWHRAFDEYHNPHGFRRELNVLLQALRNVTWVLQAEKSQINGFDEWYTTQQQSLRADRILRWVVEARNKIVKQGDLDACSVSTAEVKYAHADYEIELTNGEFASWFDSRAGDAQVRLSPPPSVTMAKQRRVLMDRLPDRVIKDGFIEFKRRWVDQSLPDIEILSACAHAFGRMAELLADLHKREGCAGSGYELGEHSFLPHESDRSGIPPCMMAPGFHVTRRRLRDGSLVVGGMRLLAPENTAEMEERVAKRYGLMPAPDEIKDVTDLGRWCMSVARTVLVRDRNHVNIVILHRGLRPVGIEGLSFKDQSDKIVMGKELAEVVQRSGVDGIVMITDNWVAPLDRDDEGFPVPAREREDRTEALQVDAIDAAGHRLHLVSPYSRIKGKIILEDVVDMSDSTASPFLAPILKVWGRGRRT